MGAVQYHFYTGTNVMNTYYASITLWLNEYFNIFRTKRYSKYKTFSIWQSVRKYAFLNVLTEEEKKSRMFFLLH